MKRSAANIVREYDPFPDVSAVHGVSYDDTNVWIATGDTLNAVDPVSGCVPHPCQLEAIEIERLRLEARLREIESEQEPSPPHTLAATVTNGSPAEDKVALFRRLFAGHTEACPTRWENLKSRRSGYATYVAGHVRHRGLWCSDRRPPWLALPLEGVGGPNHGRRGCLPVLPEMRIHTWAAAPF